MDPPASTTLRAELDARVVYSAQAQVATLSKQRLDAQLDAAASRGEADQHRQRLQTLEHQHVAALNEHERVVHQLRCKVAEWEGRAKAAELSSTHSEAESRRAFGERIADLEALVGKLQHELKQALQEVADKDVERAAAIEAAVAAEQGLAKVERAMATSTDGELRRASATASADSDGCRGGTGPPSLAGAATGGPPEATPGAARTDVTAYAEGARYGHAAAEPAPVRSFDRRSQPALALPHADSTLDASTSPLLFSLHVPFLGDAGGHTHAPGSQSRVGVRVGGTALPAACTSAIMGGHASESTSSVRMDLRIWLPSPVPRCAEIAPRGAHASHGLAAADETLARRGMPTAMDGTSELTAQGAAGSAAVASTMTSDDAHDGAHVNRQGRSSGGAQGESGVTHASACTAAAGSESTVAAGIAAGDADASAAVMRAVDGEEEGAPAEVQGTGYRVQGTAEETTSTTQQERSLSAAEQEHAAKIARMKEYARRGGITGGGSVGAAKTAASGAEGGGATPTAKAVKAMGSSSAKGVGNSKASKSVGSSSKSPVKVPTRSASKRR